MGWHLRKEVSYGHIVSTLTLAAMLVALWVKTQNRIVVLEGHLGKPSHHATEARLDLIENEISRVNAVDAAMQLRMEDMQKEILRRLDRQDLKLDRIEDRLNEHMGNGNGNAPQRN